MPAKIQISEYLRKAVKCKKEGDLQNAKTYLCAALTLEVENYYKQNHSIKLKAPDKANESGAPANTARPETYFAHYTSVETIFSILKDHEKEKPNGLRLSDASYSNDPSEGNYLKKEIAKAHQWLIDAGEDTDAFVCSFVSGGEDIGNKITYWQAYGKDGLGCSIQLPLNFCNEEFGRALYGKNGIQKAQENFKDYFELGKKIYKQLHNEKKKSFAAEFWKSFDKIRFLYKDAGYEHENEYRLIKISKEPEETFTKEHPYLKRYILDDRLETQKILTSGSHVTIGPKVINKSRLCQYLKNLAQKGGLSGPKFIPSEIPYRKVW